MIEKVAREVSRVPDVLRSQGVWGGGVMQMHDQVSDAARAWWPVPVLSATWKAEARGVSLGAPGPAWLT